ncbi:MAG: tetratricopeptide repeat protein [Methylotenera sp.]|nr:tetratricopeptide repeat protein [Methylotenera sp.]
MRPMPQRLKIKVQIKSSILNYPLFRKTSLTFTCLLAAGALSLSGCAAVTGANASSKTNHSSQKSVGKLDSEADFVYKYLAAEVAGQRGELATSSAIFYDLANTTKDASLAERAAKVAAYGNVPSLTIPAIKLWSELDPNSTEAQQAMTEVLLASGQLNDAKPYLAKLFVKEETRAGGFLYLNNLLNKTADKTGVLSLVQALAEPYPKLAEAQFAIAQSAMAAKQNKVAMNALNKADALKPGWSAAALLKGQVLFEESPKAAIDFYREFLDQHPEANEIRLNMARLLVNQKQYAAAKNEYPLIIQYAKDGADKNSAEVSAVVGLLSFQSADYAGAESYFQQALTLGFKDTDQIYIYLAQSAEKQNHNDLATTWYKKVQPGQHHLEAQISLANLIARTQSADKAIELLDGVDDLTTAQQINVIQTQASILAKVKRDKEAFDLLDKAVKNLPNTPELVYDYALAAERMQKLDLMEAELRRTIAANPNFAAAYNALGYSFADRNIKLNEAIRLIEKALSLSPNDHYMLDSLGWAHYRKGNLDKAIKYLQQAYSINPDPEIAAHLGEVLWQKGKHDEAKKIWNDALTTDPTNEVLIKTTSKFKS